MTTLPLHVPSVRRSRAAAQTGSTAGRTLASYLLVPRPKDLVKAIVLPLAFAVGIAVERDVAAAQLGAAALVWMALELLVYQARYQWNDIRGFAADQAHPDAASRGRLPGPLEKAGPHISASIAVLVLRLVLTAALAVAFPELAAILVAMTVGVFGVAVVYERLWSAATGRTSQVPVPLRPALVALWVAVGAGYAVRGLTGLALAVDLGGRPGVVALAAVSMWALGVVFVTCRWTLEAMCFGEFRDGRLTWQVRPDQAREHTLGLVRWVPSTAPDDPEASPCSWRALQGRTPLTAPWNLALVVSAAAAAAVGQLLAGAAGAGAPAAVLVAGGLLALAVVRTPGRRRLVTVAGAVALLLLNATTGTPDPLVAILPWLVVMAAYGCFTRQCSDEIGRPLRRLQPLLRG